jgi:hypothetical protein
LTSPSISAPLKFFVCSLSLGRSTSPARKLFDNICARGIGMRVHQGLGGAIGRKLLGDACVRVIEIRARWGCVRASGLRAVKTAGLRLGVGVRATRACVVRVCVDRRRLLRATTTGVCVVVVMGFND